MSDLPERRPLDPAGGADEEHDAELRLAGDDFVPTRPRARVRWDDEEDDPGASTYLLAEHGPQPVPRWVIVADEARQSELGVLKSGKEADVHLVERRHGADVNLLAAKRYRDVRHRGFRDDARYRARRRTGESRLDRLAAGRDAKAQRVRSLQWAAHEFDTLCRLWSAGVPVPYPVQRLGTEVMCEFVGEGDVGAPVLVHARPSRGEVDALFGQAIDALRRMTRAGVVHGDLSPYNVLVHRGRVIVIDLPQSVHPQDADGLDLLHRDVGNLCAWFARRGVACDPEQVFADLLPEVFG